MCAGPCFTHLTLQPTWSGFGLANTQRDLSAGRWAPELKAWFRILLNPSRPLAPKLTAYLKLLRDCNAALSLAGLAGYAVALHFLGKQCLEALQCFDEKGELLLVQLAAYLNV